MDQVKDQAKKLPVEVRAVNTNDRLGDNVLWPLHLIIGRVPQLGLQ
jgi:hypothetical protein